MAVPKPVGMSAEEDRAYDILKHFFATGVGYANEMANRPQTLYAIEDSPVGLAAWMLDHDVASYELIARAFAGNAGGLSRDEVLDNVTHYWLTKSGISVGAPLLGEPSRLLRRQGRGDPRRGDRIPGRALSGSPQLGREGLPEAHPLQRRRSWRPFRSLGAAGAALEGGARRIPIAALSEGIDQSIPVTQRRTS